jgi:NAD(P)-dependent dehydrogenase (short-subunit alcohol dehydrogenase family)
MGHRRVALVTGARKGIGKATALALAAAGFRVAVTSSNPQLPVAGAKPAAGLSSTVDAITTAGGDALALPMDLLERASIDRLVDAVIAQWGRIDVLVNNAIYQGDNLQRTVMDSDPAMLERVFLGQVVNTTYLTQRVVGAALGRHPLRVINVGSAGGRFDDAQPRPVGQGGTAFGYAASKSALHKLAPMLHTELAHAGVRAFTLNPGVVQTEALAEYCGSLPGARPVEMPAAVIAWLATAPEADALSGTYQDAATLHATYCRADA